MLAGMPLGGLIFRFNFFVTFGKDWQHKKSHLSEKRNYFIDSSRNENIDLRFFLPWFGSVPSVIRVVCFYTYLRITLVQVEQDLCCRLLQCLGSFGNMVPTHFCPNNCRIMQFCFKNSSSLLKGRSLYVYKSNSSQILF